MDSPPTGSKLGSGSDIFNLKELVNANSLQPPLEERCIVSNGKAEEGIPTQWIPDDEDRDYLTKLEFRWRLKRGSLQIPRNDPRNFIRLSAELKECFEKGYFHFVPDCAIFGPIMGKLYKVRYGSLDELPIHPEGYEYMIMARQEMEHVEIQRLEPLEDPDDTGGKPKLRTVTYRFPFEGLRIKALVHPYYAAYRTGRANPNQQEIDKFIGHYLGTDLGYHFCGSCGLEYYWSLANTKWRRYKNFTEVPFEKNRDIEPPVRKKGEKRKVKKEATKAGNPNKKTKSIEAQEER